MSSMGYYHNTDRYIREPLKTASLSACSVRKWFIVSANADCESVFRGTVLEVLFNYRFIGLCCAELIAFFFFDYFDG